MAWAAADRAVKAVEGLDGPVDRWKTMRHEIFQEVCERGYDADRKTFTQFYGSSALDATALLIPALSFVPADDERVVGTVRRIETELMNDGYVECYTPTQQTQGVDGLPPREGAPPRVHVLAR
jgi:GH15 family glucan-1,4-alpha-glucosidase